MDVVLLRWPIERARREELAAGQRARLLLVEADTSPPVIDSPLEDWIRLPANEVDLQARIDTLIRRVTRAACKQPTLDPDGVLRFGGDWVSLPPIEARLVSALIGRYGAVVTREQLASAAWPQGAPGRNALDVHVLRLRRRLTPLGLVIKTVRARGYLLEFDQREHQGTAG